jgi:hypothetical protein
VRHTILLTLSAALLAAPAAAETLLIQSGQDSSPYAFLPKLSRGLYPSGYAFTLDDEEGDPHNFEYYVEWNLPAALFEPGVEIQQALAWVYYGFNNPPIFGDHSEEIGEILCHEVLEPWIQGDFFSGMTWETRPAIGPWFDARFEILNNGIYWCDVTEVLRGWIANPGTDHGIALTSTKPRPIGFYTFEALDVSPNFKPSLMVSYVPEPGAGAGLAAGCLLLTGLDRRRARRRERPLT